MIGSLRPLRTVASASVVAFLLAEPTHAQERYVPETDPLVLAKLEQWQDLKFGLLMHWGAYSQWGIVESWSICAEDEGWCRRPTDDYEQYKRDYEKLPETFDPVDFDPKRWAEAARDAGMRYMVFTTKHHDGFCMFDTRQTDYRVTHESCAFHDDPRANITKQLFDAFRAQQMWIGAYFSKPDWHCNDYWWSNFPTPDRNPNYDLLEYPDRWQRYVEFTHAQIGELTSEYGPVDILWLDGGWVATMTEEERKAHIERAGRKHVRFQSQDIDMPRLVRDARKNQPGLIVVDRAVPGPHQNYLTPENRVPAEPIPHPWETCLISGGGWSWVKDAEYKPARELVHTLIEVVAKGGNLLLNVAPDARGRWDDGAYDRLQAIGAWLRVNGEAIYGTRATTPHAEAGVFFTRHKTENVRYVILTPEDGAMPHRFLVQSVSPLKTSDVHLLGHDKPLPWLLREEGGFIVEFPEDPPCEHAYVLRVEVE